LAAAKSLAEDLVAPEKAGPDDGHDGLVVDALARRGRAALGVPTSSWPTYSSVKSEVALGVGLLDGQLDAVALVLADRGVVAGDRALEGDLVGLLALALAPVRRLSPPPQAVRAMAPRATGRASRSSRRFSTRTPVMVDAGGGGAGDARRRGRRDEPEGIGISAHGATAPAVS
jgi:hypothetical protein